MPKFIDLTGQRFGKLLVIEVAEGRSWGNYLFTCICDCGNTTTQSSNNLRRGMCVSCGCYRDEIRGKASITHGMTKSAEYKKLKSAIARCHDPKQTGYDRYGGEGVYVCDSWRGDDGFILFYEHIGPIPTDGQKWTLDRIDPSKGYEQGNVRWLPDYLQARNKGKMKTNTTGTTGVVREEYDGYVRFRAFWCDLETGKNRSKSFSVSKLGHEQAFQLACDYRNKMIQELNAQGAGYSLTHGK